MSVIIRLQNLPWSANALDIRNFFRGLSIPEGGVHIVGGELGDAFIAFSTDEDARQAMMLDCGKIKEIQVKLLLSSRSEMHKVIEAARQSVPILSLAAPAPAVVPHVATAAAPVAPVGPVVQAPPVITPFSAALGNTSLSNYGIPGMGNPQEIPQPAVIEPPPPLVSPPMTVTPEDERDDDKSERKRSKEKDRRRSRSRSRSRDRDRKDRKRDRRDRSRSRERRRRDRSRSRDRRDRKRDRKDRSRSRDRSPSRRSRDRRNMERRSPQGSQEKTLDIPIPDGVIAPPAPAFGNTVKANPGLVPSAQNSPLIPQNGPMGMLDGPNRFNDPTMAEAFNKLQELGKKRNPNAFQGDQQNGGGAGPGRFAGGRGANNMSRGGANFRREGRISRFDNEPLRDCCVAIRNAPNHTSYGDVRRFFPFMIDKHGIKMINDNMGRRTGNIFVRFCDTRSKHLAIQRKDNELKGAKVTVEPLDDEAYENAVDSFLPYREDNDEEDPNLVIADSEEPPPTSFSVLKLADLPAFVKEHDIIKTFSDFSLLSIMLNDCRITRTKIAYVQFVKSEDARLALNQKDQYQFGRRPPIITAVSDKDYEKEKATQPSQMPDPRVAKNDQRNVPSPQEREPVVPRDPRQRRQFDNGPAAQSSPQGPVPPTQTPFFPGPFLQGQQFGAPFGSPQYSGIPSGTMDPRAAAANWVNRPSFPHNQISGPPTMLKPTPDNDEELLDCVLMKGLPRDATDRTIVTFLTDTGAVPSRIHLMLDQNSQPSGDCFCEFRSVQEARMAASKHGHDLDGCRITVDLVARSVVEEALDGPKQEVSEGLLGSAPPQFFEPRGGYQPRGGYRGRGGFARGFDRGGFRGAFDGRGGFRGRGIFNDRGRGFDRGRGRGFGRGRGGFENGREREIREEDQDPALEDFGAPGCVVSMENVPFRATVDDILTFFSEFELSQDDVIRRYNERGQPTGDARVAFRTPFDAQRAVKTRHMDTIHDRRINLTIL